MTARQLDSNGWYEIKDNPISKVGVFPYRGAMIDPSGEMGLLPDEVYMVYRSEAELSDPEAVKSFELVPWTFGHEMLGNDSPYLTPADEKGVDGVTGQEVYFRDGTLFSNIKLFSESLRDAIESGVKELSCGFRCKYVLQEGVFGDQAYVVAQTKIRGNHVASVPEGRMGPDVAVLDEISTGTLTVAFDSKDFNLMADENDKDATDENNDDEYSAKDVMDALGALDAKLSGFMAGAAADADDDDESKAEDEDDDDKAEDMVDMHDKDSDLAEDEDEDDKDKASGMDAAEVRSLRREVRQFKRTGTKGLLREMRKREALYNQVSPFVGAFDYDDMDAQEIAVFGCKELKLAPRKGHELSALEGYLSGRKPPTAGAVFALDSASAQASNEPTAIASLFGNK